MVAAAVDHVQSLSRMVLLEHDVHAACSGALIPLRSVAAAASSKIALAHVYRYVVSLCTASETLAGAHNSVPLAEEVGIPPGAVTVPQLSPVNRGRLHDCDTERISASDLHSVGHRALDKAGDSASGCSIEVSAATRHTRRSEPQRQAFTLKGGSMVNACNGPLSEEHRDHLPEHLSSLVSASDS